MATEGVTGESAGAEVAAKRSRKRQIIIFIAATIINGGLLVALGFALLTPAANQPRTSSNNAAAPLGDVSSPLIGKAAPDFALPALNKGSATVHLSDFKGHPVVLNFWQSTCDPCQAEAPFLQKTWTQYQSSGVVFIGIDVLDTTRGAQAFMRKYGITYINVADANGATDNDYNIDGFPETYFIDKNGVVVAKWISPLTAQGLKLEMAKLNINA
jgi:cytochrome c biogenesis protein CcmG/thiol:disulfide interchange protein DsbE